MTTDGPLISVLTVVRNDPAGLRRTLQSFNIQTWPSREMVIVDGASKDETVDIALSAAENQTNVRALSEPDSGIYDAMNKALRMSKGDIVVWMNAGDVFGSASSLQVVVDHWSPDTDWAVGLQRYVQGGRVVRVSNHIPIDFFAFTMGLRWLPHQAVYMRRSFYTRLGGFDESIGSGADQELLLRAFAVRKPSEIPEFLTDFEVGGVHEFEGNLAREMMWHRMRKKNGWLLGRSVLLDLLFCASMAIYRRARIVASQLRKKALRPGRRRIGATTQ